MATIMAWYLVFQFALFAPLMPPKYPIIKSLRKLPLEEGDSQSRKRISRGGGKLINSREKPNVKMKNPKMLIKSIWWSLCRQCIALQCFKWNMKFLHCLTHTIVQWQKTAVEAVRPYGTVKEWDSGRMGGKIRLHTL